jgi:hypothetical protein
VARAAAYSVSAISNVVKNGQPPELRSHEANPRRSRRRTRPDATFISIGFPFEDSFVTLRMLGAARCE